MSINLTAENPILRTVAPLRLIFWGGLLLIFDFSFFHTSNGEGFSFDILNDTVGAILITTGASRLAVLDSAFHGIDPRYSKAMQFVTIVSFVAIADTFLDHFVFDRPDGLVLITTLFSLVSLLAIVVFCSCMVWVSRWGNLYRSQQSWTVTKWLFAGIYLVPLGLFYIVSLHAVATDSSFDIDLGIYGIPLLFVFAAPVIHLFISTSRMRGEAVGTPVRYPQTQELRSESRSSSKWPFLLIVLLLVVFGGIYGLKWATESHEVSVEYDPPAFNLEWQSYTDNNSSDWRLDKNHTVYHGSYKLHVPRTAFDEGNDVMITAEIKFDSIRDTSSLFSNDHNSWSAAIDFKWDGKSLSVHPWDKPYHSYSITSGKLDWPYKITQEAPNQVKVLFTLQYLVDGDPGKIVEKETSVTVEVEEE